MANLFKWWVKFKVVGRKKNVGHGCNNITEGLEPKFCPNLCKKQRKKIFTSKKGCPASRFQCHSMEKYAFLHHAIVRYRFFFFFFRKIFQTVRESLTWASGSLGASRVSGSPSLA